MPRVLVPALTTPPARPVGGSVRAFGGATMGTTWSVKAVLPATTDLPALEAMVQRALDTVVAQMSPWEPLSHLSRYNRAAPGSWTSLPTAILTVLRRAIEVAEASHGAFDPTLGPLTDLWGFGPAPFSGQPPTAETIASLRDANGWKRLVLDGDALLQPGGLSLDLNGIAKGFGVDQAAAALDRAGVKSYLVEVGGELRGTGAKPDGQPWWVELERPPTASGGDVTVVALHDLSVATSGDYRRFFDHAGRRYAHTLDPATGAPTTNPTVSVTVLAKDCMSADAWATALTVIAPDDALAFAAGHDLAALIVSRSADGLDERLSPALQAMLDG
ncbi:MULTISPECIES: FAD:protein FMN transferase [unclassified Caulobacter]|uniref:FAD:protein FMN transferase n=1 Tax=unclassified Caulobacter TaxID=2648921 RepID=UPI0006F8C969|nr:MULTISPECIES: FAD:protein FMN transferase [unclassified Caulobacter]KQV55872.1 thiamine biosynthesis protein ApbE [Caulobacter sp. Root342]KQV70954.1 thiamine biosynthesis protein ApbE [Caulobacter sp. Root343]